MNIKWKYTNCLTHHSEGHYDESPMQFRQSGSAKRYNGNLSATEYTCNTNGAMTKDLNKGISDIQYNSLNLPRLMDIKSPVAEARNEYTYSASGQKLKAVQNRNPNYSTTPLNGVGSAINTSSLSLSKTTEYIGNVIYENGALKRILIDGGYIEGGVYYYFLTDHQGNNRLVVNADGAVIQKNHYYPFGMPVAETPIAEQGKQPYKYNGKELDMMNGLNQYDYSARFYDPAIARFTTMDPMAEKYYSISPYAYCNNNPVKFVDPKGKTIRLSGTDEFMLSTLYSLQEMTSASLVLLKNGIVMELSGNNYRNKDIKYFGGLGEGEKYFGASTLQTLINSKYTISIEETTKPNDHSFTPANWSNAMKEGKGSGGKVRYNPKDDGSEQIQNENGTKGTKPFIFLGHELRHAVHSVDGIIKNTNNEFKRDPDSPDNWPLYISTEEYNTRKEENIIRSENHLDLRAIPK